MSDNIELKGIELGKSLVKVLLSEKYKEYSIEDLTNILIIAQVKAQELLDKEGLTKK
jgi:hypothetical protein